MDYIYREEVLDHGFVELIDILPREEYKTKCETCKGHSYINGYYNDSGDFIERCEDCNNLGYHETSRDLAIVNAARTSYLGESKGIESDKKLLKYLYKNKHTTPFEMVEFKFRIKAPILVWWQWVRHRSWSYNLQSGRYTEYEDEFYIPDEWRLQDTKNKQGSTQEFIKDIEYQWGFGTDKIDIQSMFQTHLASGFSYYQELLTAGVAKEQARLFLPAFALYHIGIAKVDAKNLLDFLRLRNDEHAQFEIREYAKAIEKMFAQVLPWTYESFIEERNNK